MVADSLAILKTEPSSFTAQPDKTVLIPLDHLCCYEVSGEDAQTFLQGQLTNDINHVTSTHAQLSGYCTPKGRMLAIFRICRKDNKYLILIRKDIAASVIKRLQMFVLRAKVKIVECPSDHILVGLAGPAAESTVSALHSTAPANDNQVTSTENAICVKIPGVVPRYIIIGDASFNINIEKLESSDMDVYPNTYWQWLDILSGIPSVSESTQESFVPQMANMELIDGVSFSKGCYPGQEIVARLHYLGNASRRMFRIEASTDEEILPGNDVYQPASKQAIGAVVSAVKEEPHKIAALAVMRIEAAQQNQLTIGSPDGIPATIMPLPYEIPTEKKQ